MIIGKFYQIDNEEFETLFNLFGKENNIKVLDYLTSLFANFDRQDCFFYFKKVNILFLERGSFLLKKENSKTVKLVVIGKFLTSKSIIDLGILYLEVTEIKKRYYFRVVPSQFFEVFITNSNIIKPIIFEVTDSADSQKKTVLALLG